MMEEIRMLKILSFQNAKPLFDEHIAKCTRALIVDLTEDTIGTIIYSTQAAKKLFGYPELDAKNLKDIIPVRFRERHNDHLRHFRANPKERPMGSLQMSLIGLKNDGSEFPIEIGLNPIELIGKQLVIAILLETKK